MESVRQVFYSAKFGVALRHQCNRDNKYKQGIVLAVRLLRNFFS